ncbi:MAG: hypothetical protein HY225_00495 [Candidatus Vogelbacteria bacterium]|nr:hypothetical protein [Candidatus Vogelbacteria bacterium]
MAISLYAWLFIAASLLLDVAFQVVKSLRLPNCNHFSTMYALFTARNTVDDIRVSMAVTVTFMTALRAADVFGRYFL